MDIKEATNIIGLPKTASSDDFKKKYKELAKKYHPDVYKEDPEKFKKINEAYQFIEDYKKDPDKYDRPPQSPFRRSPFEHVNVGSINFDDIFNGGNGFNQEQSKTFKYNPLIINLSISFKESVLGVNKEINFKKYIKCNTCAGKGAELIGNKCQDCNGFGRITNSGNGMMFTRVCPKCFGKDVKTKPCTTCNAVGVSEVDTSVTIHIPPGTLNGSTLRMQGGGHYVGPSIFGDAHADVFVNMTVPPEDGLILEGPNVISHLKLSLLEALSGCNKEVKTIYDTRTIQVPAKSKNKDEIFITGCGVISAGGSQRVVLDIDYPSDTEALIKYLKKKEN